MTPDWALTLIYWTHMIATVVWIGGLSLVVFLIIPITTRSLPAGDQVIFYEQLQRKFDPVSWLCLLLLIGTGLFQMSANPNYQGFLDVSNRWAVAILIKHLLFGGMMVVNGILSWGVLPGLKNAALLRKKGFETPEEGRLRRREVLLLRVNFLLGILILGMTALARVS
jgi:uncharacterized membrane protein